MHDRLYRRGDKLGEHDLTHHAVILGLEIYRFQSELDSRTHDSRVRRDIDSGTTSGVKGTPTFFINGARYNGPAQADQLLAAVAAAAAGGERQIGAEAETRLRRALPGSSPDPSPPSSQLRSTRLIPRERLSSTRPARRAGSADSSRCSTSSQR